MLKYAETIILGGGEGVMLRKPTSAYENGRSHSIVKYKVYFTILAVAVTIAVFAQSVSM